MTEASRAPRSRRTPTSLKAPSIPKAAARAGSFIQSTP